LAAERSPALVELLLQHGANPNLNDYYGDTPLKKAFRAGRMDNASLLLDHRANPDERDTWGRTMLEQAVLEDRLDKVRLLHLAENISKAGKLRRFDRYFWPHAGERTLDLRLRSPRATC
jgi:ankyrin repeat protein